jgi:hypothetical protein
VLNVVDAALAQKLQQLLLDGPGASQPEIEAHRAAVAAISARAFSAFSADFDFVYAFTSEQTYSSVSGMYWAWATTRVASATT